jgi:hypothetical protein
MNLQSKILQNLVFILGFFLVIVGFYGPQFELWSRQIPGSGEDGSKNYYSVAYHIEHDESLIWFQGMNYPEGEHVLFTDNQPLISNTLKLIGGSADWLPYLVFLSFILGGWCLFWICRKEGVEFWFSMLVSITIMLLNPQLLRLGGHYSLAYSCLIPGLMFLFYQKHGTSNLKIELALTLCVLLAAFVHPYFLIMLSLFWLCLEWIDLLGKNEQKNWKNWLNSTVWPLLPIVLFQLLMWFSDPVIDRPSNPFGFLFYRATWASIFLPLDFEYFEPWSEFFTQSQEGGLYIGLFAISGIAFGLLRWIRSKNRFQQPLSNHAKFLLASIPLLLLSLAFPLYIWKLEKLIPFLGPLKQFRGIARFSFVFYYAASLYSLIEFGKFLMEKPRMIRSVLMGVLVLISFTESWYLRSQVIKKTSSGTSIFHQNMELISSDLINSEKFQVILPLPYFHVGSENFRTPEVEGIREETFALSLKSGIPIHAVQMSRTSLSQTLKHLSLTSFLAPDSNRFSNFNGKPLLLLVKLGEPLSIDNKKLIAHAEFISRKNNYAYYKLPVSAFSEIANSNCAEIRSQVDSLINNDSTDKPVVYSFDESVTDLSFKSIGALSFERIAWTEIIPKSFRFDSDTQYELSFWFFAGQQNASNAQIWFWERKDNEEIRFEVTEVGDHLTQVIDDWILVTIPLQVTNPRNSIELSLHRDGKNMNLWLDEVMLRKTKQNYFQPGFVNLNNRYCERPKT